MKRTLIFAAAIALSLMLLVGCVSPAASGSASPQPTSSAAAGAASAAAGEGEYIGEDEAREIALAHANVTNPSGVVVQLDRDDGRVYYDVKFYDGNTEYDYDIDATTGDVVKFEADTTILPSAAASEGAQYIGEDQAQQAALEHARVTDPDYIRVQMDRDDGKVTYEVEFYKDSTEYDYVIDAESGQVLEYNASSRNNGGGQQTAASGDIGQERAQQIALEHAQVTDPDYIRVQLDRDDGRSYYDVEFFKDNAEYNYEIDTATGDIIEFDVDSDF